ncbi:MAG: choice-of-anchor J domain-containing protein, partial [Bacteroidales bacterium]|nr:choice-of-anchor J domain-containing protein [Bacteroidales bacterium]
MKRKVFSLLMLCLFAFLGMANAQPKGDGITVTPDPIDLGYRPIGAWMRPLDVQFVNEGVAKTIINIEADKTFFVIDAQLPGTITNARPYEFTITHGEAEPGVIQGNLVAMTENRKAYVFDIMAVAYNPIEADVVETAPVIELPFTATVGENIYNNYLLPGDKADGKDVVYKMNIENDILFSANVQGANGKVALYNEDFNGEPGPGATNNFGGQSTGGGEPFEAQIGSVTGSSNGYFPFYTLYNYSIAENLFLASELEEAGVTTAPMGSLSWYATNSTGAEQKNLSIWMANVSEDVLTNSSYITSDMTLVYSGNMTPQVGWNEFVFNQDNFAWDGSSNVLICVQRNNGSWNNTIYWATHAPGFAGQAYKYTDSAPYDMETTSYPITPTSNNRASIVFKSVGRTDEPEENIEDGMTLTPGVYYLVASSTSDEFTVNVNSEILPAPEPPYNPSPFDGETGITSPAVLTWTFGEYTTGYRVLLGTTYPPVDVVVDWTNNLNNTLVVPNLYNNKTYLWQVEERNSNGVTSGPIWGFTTALNVPQNVTAENPKIYEGDVLHMSWTAINDRSYRGYNVYQDGVKINEGLLTTTEFSVAGLTYNTTTGYNFNVTAVYDEGESNFSNDLNVLVSGDGSISGKVLEIDGATGIANATVNFDGVDEFNRPVSYTFTTGSNGTYTGVMRAGNYTAMVSKEGYQAVESDGTIHIDYDENTSNVNFMLQEILYPVGEVIAEEMSDTQVKVYWSQNIMSEIIEDFETGDFNSFDWQNNSSYPWAITTTQPYEGTYCMKSTNEAIASSTSSIEVSVEINRDGLMSFYHRISSEGTYDKGYFYIDGVEKKYVSGNAPWAQLEYPITAGVHTFKWAYTKDSSVNSNEDCWYVDNISFIHDAEPMPAGTIFDFEDNSFMGWISLDADGDGYGWELGADVLSSGGYGHNGSDGMVLSRSYVNSYGPLTPDNYLISPQVTLGGSISFYACAQDASYAAEHFGVAVSTTGMNASDFTTIQEWTMSAKGEPYPGPRGTRAQGNWYLYTVDLSAYSGQGYVALRHFNCTDMFYLDVDDIIISDEPAKNRAFDHYNVYRAFDGDEANAELITSVTDTVFFDNEWADLEPGVYKWGVSRVYEGNRGNREVILSEGFEGSLSGWVVIDADGDGQNWGVYGSSSSPAGHNSNVTATSASYSGGVLYPDNYLVTPEVTLGGSVNFWACAQDASWPSEHFGVAISTTTNDDPSAFTTIQEWTMSAKSIGQPTDETRSGNRAQGAWYEFTVDLSSYSGQGYIAFRHFNCSDWFRLNVDDVVVTAGGNPEPPVPPITGGNESDIVWSNIIEHNMFVGASVTVNTNSGDDVTGTTVTLTNTSEPGLNYNYNVTLDETGIYTWESIRRGTYDVSVNLEGFEPITESVEISDNTQLNYTLHEIITAVSDLYVSGTGWAIFGNIPTPDNPDGPTPPSDGWTEGFENGGIPANWTVLDSNNDSYTWTATSAIPTTWTYYASLSLDWYHTGTDAVCSGSYINGVGALSPDEYLITPQVTPSNGSTFSFWAAAADASYPADHFSVAVSTTTPTASEFTMLQEWTLTAKEGGMNGGRASREGKGAKLGSWHSYSVDLSSYAGQSIYIAIHHFGCYDQYIMCVDDIEFTTARSVEYYNVKLDGVLEGTTTNPFFQHDVEGFVEGETHTTSVQKVYTTGESEWVSFDWVYTPCDNFGGLQAEPTAQWQGENVVLNWVLPEGGDTPTPPDPQPTTVYDFEDGTMQGWTSLDADGDGFGWDMMSNFGPGYGHNASQDGVFSQSYNNNYGALNPDNYLVSPQVELGGEISFYACAQDASWAAEHFGVAVSTTTATAAAFTTIQEWTMSAKGVGAPTNVTRDGSRAQGNWYLYTVDLSNYAGQTGYVAIRHFACTDMFYLDVDDITLGGGGGDTPTPPDPPAGNTYDFEDGT